MSTPDNSDTPTPESSYEEKVNNLLTEMSTEGWEAPEDLDPGLLFAAKAEKRRRDTQSEFTKAQQKLKAAEARETKLVEQLEAVIVESLPLKQQTRLEELKATDPDAWRAELTKLEQSAKGDLAKKIETITNESNQLSELEQRKVVLQQFLDANPGVTAEAIDEDVPPRISNKLAKGEITFEEFLEQSVKYLTANKIIDPGAKAPDFDDLGKMSGGSKPGSDDMDEAANASYDKEVY